MKIAVIQIGAKKKKEDSLQLAEKYIKDERTASSFKTEKKRYL